MYAAFPVRKTASQKAAFREALLPVLEAAGWPVAVESSGRLPQSNNLVAGSLKTAKTVYTAHYDTPARLPIPNLIAPRNLLVTILYQLLLAVIMVAVCLLAVIGAVWLGLPGPWPFLISLALALGMTWLLMAGPANPNNANDNTSGVMALVQIALTLPAEKRGEVALVFFDNEELGLVGSGAFRRRHGPLPGKLLLNFDCVANGDTLLFVQPGACRRDKALGERLARAFSPEANRLPHKTVMIDRSPFSFYPSDQMHFKRGIGVAALLRAPLVGLYLNRIHTARDVVFDEDNILLLAAGAARLAAAPTEQNERTAS